MLPTVASESERATAIPRKSPLTSVTWALFIATSVPVPIAIPTSALAKAGASLIPSPAIATMRPSFCNLLTSSSLSAGLTSPCTSSIPRRAATERAVVRPSPVAITIRSPASFRVASASGVLFLMGSDTASRPANSPLMARCITLAPSERSSSACGIRDCTEIPNCSISAVLPKAN